VDQDYYSPQAQNFFLHLVILAVVLRWFRPRAEALVNPTGRGRLPAALARTRDRVQGFLRGEYVGAASADGLQRSVLLVIMVLIFLVSVTSHQLTPFTTLLIVGGLVVFGRCTARGLLVIMAILIATWLVYGAGVFLSGHLLGLLEH